MGRAVVVLRPATLAVVALWIVGLAGCGFVADEPEPVSVEPDVEPDGVAIEVVRIVDGDSLHVVSADGEEIEVRLVGINAPEATTLAGAESCAGEEATEALRSILEVASSGQLHLRGAELDRFGRLLADIDVRSSPGAAPVSAGAAMVDAGWALGLWSAGDPALVEAMERAAAQGTGWWGTICGEPRGGLEISDHQVDPPGPDGEVLAEEWIEVTNTRAEAVDLKGWTIRDETTSHRFPLDGVVLAAGASVRVRTGPGASSAGDLHLGEADPVWSNRGETVLLVDPEGRIAAHAFIAGRRA
jgi:endonuclease YncB( thermonuclease family)